MGLAIFGCWRPPILPSSSLRLAVRRGSTQFRLTERALPSTGAGGRSVDGGPVDGTGGTGDGLQKDLDDWKKSGRRTEGNGDSLFPFFPLDHCVQFRTSVTGFWHPRLGR